MVRTKQRQTYGEEVANVLTHGAGMIFGMVALILLVVASIRSGNPWAVGSSIVYALSMTSSYVASIIALFICILPGRILLSHW